MTEVLVFGGTAEGRELAGYGASLGIGTLLSVVSEYGKRTAGEGENLSLRCGALDEEGIFRLLEAERPLLILDATHPHAVSATRQIRTACERAGLPYLRVLRDSDKEGEEAREKTGEGKLVWVQTAKEAAELLTRSREPIFLTTGSKELAVFAANPQLKERIFARVLPDSQVLAGCEKLGLAGRQLIAMQGPFSEEMNVAMLRATGAGWLVTKESGSRGGFWEKLRAAATCGIPAIIIRRPDQEPGISAEEAREELTKLAKALKGQEERSRTKKKRQTGSDPKEPEERELFLIGMGMGGGNQLTLEALEKLRQCEAVLGAPRMLEDVQTWVKGKHQEAVYLGNQVWSWLARHPRYKRVAVVYSGDTGFYSGSGSLLEIWRAEQERKKGDVGIRIRVFPGISTLSCLCSRLGCSWEDIYPASAHGRACDVEGLLKEHARVFLLLGGEEKLSSLCRRLEQAGLGAVRVSAGIRLGYPEERIVRGEAGKLTDREEDSLAAVLLERQEKSGKGSFDGQKAAFPGQIPKGQEKE